MATKRIRGITIELDANTTKLNEALKGVNKNIASLNSQLKDVNKSLKFDPSNTDLLKQKQSLLSKEIQETTKKLEELKKTQSEIDSSNMTDEQRKSYELLQREIVNTESKLKGLEKDFNSVSNNVKIQLTAWGTKFKEVGNKIKDLGSKFKVLSGLSAGALIGATKSAIDFETAFAGVEKTVDGTEKQMAELRDGLLELSKRTASSSSDIASVAEAAGQLGVSTENILNFTETMVRLGDSTNLSAEEAAASIAKLYNVMKSDINSVDRFGAAIVELGNNAATTEADILNMATRISSSSKQIGLNEAQVLGFATTLSSLGLEAEAGGTAFSKIMTTIDKAVSTNGKTLETWAKISGLSVKDFKKQWETDAAGALEAMIKGLGRFKAEGGNVNLLLSELDLSEVRVADTMKRLTNAGELTTRMLELSNKAWNKNTALTKESDKRYQTTAARLQQLKNSISELGVRMGEILLPIVQKVVDGLKGFTNWLSSLDKGTRTAVLGFIGFTAAIAPVVIGLGNIITAVGTLSVALAGLNFNPIVLGATAIGGVVAAIGLFNNKSKEYSLAQQAMIDKSNELKATAEAEKKSWDELSAARQKMLNAGMSEATYYQNLKTELDGIVDSNGRVKDGYEARAQFIATELSKYLGTEITLNNGIIQNYKNIREEIDKLIEKKKAQIILESQEEAYTEAIKNKDKAYRDFAATQEELSKAQSRLDTAEKNLADTREEYIRLTNLGRIEEAGAYKDRFEFYQQEIVAAQEAVRNVEETMDKRKDVLEGYEYAIETYEYNVEQSQKGHYDKMKTADWDYVRSQGKTLDSQQAQYQSAIDTAQGKIAYLRTIRNESNKKEIDAEIAKQQAIIDENQKGLQTYNDTTRAALGDNERAWLDTLAKQIQNATGQKVEWKEVGRGQVQAYVNGQKYGEPFVASESKDIKQIVLNALKANSQAESTGKDIVQGLINGLKNKNKTSMLGRAGTSLANIVINAINSAAGVNSPSKLTMSTGRFIDEGLLIGLQKGREEVLNEASMLGSDVVGAINGETMIDSYNNALSGLKGQVDASLNPTINPQANLNPLYIQIENFNNNRNSDVQSLAQELEFYRRESAQSRGGN